jgi:hypothetical protein
MKVGGLFGKRKGTRRSCGGEEIREGNGDEYDQNTLYICMKIA